MQDFDDFLAAESFGGQLDSSGGFTLSRDKAMEKLARMNLNHPSEWVLKMVQAAVVGRCSRIQFTLRRRTTTVDLIGGHFSLDDVKHGLLTPEAPTEPVYQELLIGLRSLLFRSNFRLRTSDGSWVA